MKLTSKIKYLHVSPQKCRLVVDLIRGIDVEKAEIQLKNLRKNASLPILKLLNTAVASAEHNNNMEKSNLYISKIFVDGGTVMKRWKPRAFGKTNPIIKRTSHITLVLDERIVGKKRVKKTENKIKDKIETKKEMKELNNRKNKFNKDNKNNSKPAKDGGVFKKIFRRKSV